jgi:hypothetical protein
MEELEAAGHPGHERGMERTAWSMVPLPASASSCRWAVRRDGAACTTSAWMRALGEEPAARRALTEVLRAAPFDAYFWETPPTYADDAGPPAELVVVESAALGRCLAEPSAFAAAFRKARTRVATFANLAGDAVLLAPLPEPDVDAAHLAAFLRTAPDAVTDALWIAVARAVASWQAERDAPVWVSTSGLGVPWRHVRLDRAPKYHAYRPYAAMAADLRSLPLPYGTITTAPCAAPPRSAAIACSTSASGKVVTCARTGALATRATSPATSARVTLATERSTRSCHRSA